MPASAQPYHETFAAALGVLGGRARRVRGGRAVADAIEIIARQHSDSASVLYEPGGLVDDVALHLALRARGVKLVSVESAGAQPAAFEIGLTSVELAIAQSGTLLIGGDVGGWGLVAALPRIHIALLRTSDIEPDLSAAFPRFERAFSHGQRNWVWVSGPSKTADIAMQLVTGVHGPNMLEVLIVDDQPGGRG